MPRFDGTGPEGMGRLTGRGVGACQRNFAGFNDQEKIKILEAKVKELKTKIQELNAKT